MDPDVPLIVPQVNSQDIKKLKKNAAPPPPPPNFEFLDIKKVDEVIDNLMSKS